MPLSPFASVVMNVQALLQFNVLLVYLLLLTIVFHLEEVFLILSVLFVDLMNLTDFVNLLFSTMVEFASIILVAMVYQSGLPSVATIIQNRCDTRATTGATLRSGTGGVGGDTLTPKQNKFARSQTNQGSLRSHLLL